jgi:hypothetical protein
MVNAALSRRQGASTARADLGSQKMLTWTVDIRNEMTIQRCVIPLSTYPFSFAEMIFNLYARSAGRFTGAR